MSIKLKSNAKKGLRLLSCIIFSYFLILCLDTLIRNITKPVPYLTPYLKAVNQETSWAFTYLGAPIKFSIFLKENLFINDPSLHSLLIPEPSYFEHDFIHRLWPDVIGMSIFPSKLKTDNYKSLLTNEEYEKLKSAALRTVIYHNERTDKSIFHFHIIDAVESKDFWLKYFFEANDLHIFILPINDRLY